MPPPFEGLNINKIPIIIPITGRGFINQGSGLFRREAETKEAQKPTAVCLCGTLAKLADHGSASWVYRAYCRNYARDSEETRAHDDLKQSFCGAAGIWRE